MKTKELTESQKQVLLAIPSDMPCFPNEMEPECIELEKLGYVRKAVRKQPIQDRKTGKITVKQAYQRTEAGHKLAVVFENEGLAKQIESEPKLSIEQVADIVGKEGLGYSVCEYLNADRIENKRLRDLWKQASECMQEIREILGLDEDDEDE